MSAEQQEFQQLLERIQAGSQDAARELLDRYGRHILTVIRQKLHISLRSVFDSLDFAQDVWASFFTGPLPQNFRDPKALIKFLVQIARNKMSEVVRQRMTGEKYNISNERSLEGSARIEAAGLTAAGSPPGELAAAREEWARLQEELPLHEFRILQMHGEGFTQRQIASELGLNVKTVYRILEKIASRSRS